MTVPHESSVCPCGSGADYGQCCQRFHEGAAAPTPELLMRSRYCAFVKKLPDYLIETWHPSTRPSTLELDNSPAWAGLQILSSDASGNHGQVHFRVVYKSGRVWGYLQEHSRFLEEDGRWFYVDGKTEEGVLRPGRNESCPCGSGRKFKACCL